MHMREGGGPEAMAGYWLNRASRLLVRLGDARLRPLGLSMGQLPVLRALADGAAHSQAELARIAGVEQPSMAETLARMHRDGVIERQPHQTDRRVTMVALTRRSRARFSKAAVVLRDAERDAMAEFSDDEYALLRALLQRLVSSLEANEVRGAAHPLPRRAR